MSRWAIVEKLDYIWRKIAFVHLEKLDYIGES
jgi:hypothetical protein